MGKININHKKVQMKKLYILILLIFSLFKLFANPNNPEDKCGILQAHLYIYHNSLQRFNTDMKDINFNTLIATYTIIIGILKNEYHEGYINEKTLNEFYSKRVMFLEQRLNKLEDLLEVAYWKMMYLDSVNHQDELAIVKGEIEKYLSKEIKVLTSK